MSTESNYPSQTPSLAVDNGGVVHVAWADWTDYQSCGTDYDIFYKYKPSGGNWTVTEVVSTESTGYSYGPSLAVDSNDVVHVAWDDDADYGGSGSDRDIFYKYRRDGGGSQDTWTFAVITDLHIGRGYTDYNGEDYYLTEQLQDTVNWIISNKNKENIKFVAVLGDITENGDIISFTKTEKIQHITQRVEVKFILPFQ